MAEEQNTEVQNQPTQNSESVETETPREQETQTEDISSVKEELVKKQKEIDKLYARAKQAEENEKKLKERLAALEPKESPQQTQSKIDPVEIEERVELRLQGYNPQEIEYIKKFRKEGQSLLEAAKDSFVQAGIEGLRAKAKVEQATPNPSSRTGVVEGKSIGDMTPQERAKHFNYAAWKARRKSKV